MELHVSGNRVTGRYGENMNKTIEGEMSGNVLTGWWREEKTYGRFQNSLSADGNSWSGKWNMMKDTLGGWNGGWQATRIGKKTPSPAGQAARHQGSSSLPKNMDCGGSIAGLIEYPKQRVASEQHGELGTRKNGRSTYACWYRTSRGEEIFISGSFFPQAPVPPDDDSRYDLQSHCSSSKSYLKGVATGGKGMRVQINRYTEDKLNPTQIQQLVDFHTRQMVNYAISCPRS